MTLALPTLLLFTFASIASMFLSMSEGAVTCRLNGVCDDTRTSPSDGSTVCSNCKSCTFKNCCNKVYTSELTKCPIPGWRAKGYKGTFPVDITAPKKRDVGCSKTNRCPDGSKCVAYTKGGDKGFCWKAPGLLEKTLIALAAVAGLFIFHKTGKIILQPSLNMASTTVFEGGCIRCGLGLSTWDRTFL
ncbi:hypothetical protein GPALN_002219 [Globodera pallida]|nr:hypothetical protein GPALN_002219 [Globodera pallida]